MKFDRMKLYMPNDGGDQGGGADGAGAGGGAGAGNSGGGTDGGAGNAGGDKSGDQGKPKRDPLYADLPDDHPLVKRHEALKQENKELRPKAKIVDDAEAAKRTDAEKIADLQGKLDAQPKAVAEALRDHLVELHGIEAADAELFLTGDTPELMLRQVKALLGKASGSGPKRKNYVQKEGNPNGQPPADENKSFVKALFGGGDDD